VLAKIDPTNTIGDAHALCESGLLVLPDKCLPLDWKLSAGGYVVSPLSEGPVYDEYVRWRWSELTEVDTSWAVESQL
jgi:hypothetical protein